MKASGSARVYVAKVTSIHRPPRGRSAIDGDGKSYSEVGQRMVMTVPLASVVKDDSGTSAAITVRAS